MSNKLLELLQILTGVILPIAHAGTPAAIDGWLPCDGAAVSRTTYARLFSAIGTTWGVGDGSTTFNVPDLKGRTIIGAGAGSGLTSRAVAESGGEETHLLITSEMPAHTHSVNGAASAALGSATGGNDHSELSVGNTGSQGGGGAHNNMQPFKALHYIIKT